MKNKSQNSITITQGDFTLTFTRNEKGEYYNKTSDVYFRTKSEITTMIRKYKQTVKMMNELHHRINNSWVEGYEEEKVMGLMDKLGFRWG